MFKVNVLEQIFLNIEYFETYQINVSNVINIYTIQYKLYTQKLFLVVLFSNF